MIQDYAAAEQRLKDLDMRPNWTNAVVIAEALKRGVWVEKDPRKGSLLFTYEGQDHRWQGGQTTLNSPLANTVAQYKDVSSRLLRNRGVRAPENGVFHADDEERAWSWAAPLLPVVVKPHDGKRGREVHVGIETREQFRYAYQRVSASGGTVLVEQFHTGVEHRCLLVDHRLIAVTRRRPASVLGDGASSIRKLVASKNAKRGRIHKRLRLNAPELSTLEKQGFSPEDTPSTGERVYLRGVSNLHVGGDALDATDTVTAEERSLIEKAARALPGLRVSGIDFLLPREGDGDAPAVIEVNKAPMISMHHFPWEGQPRDVASAVLDAMFPTTKARR